MLKKYQNYFFLIGVLVLLFMAYKLGFDTIYENLRKTGWWFVPIFGIWIVVYLFNAWSLNIIITDGTPESEKVSIWRLLRLTISAYAINYMTPLGIGGEPYKALKLKNDLGTHKATSSVLLYVMMHYVSHFFFWLISIPVFISMIIINFFARDLNIMLTGEESAQSLGIDVEKTKVYILILGAFMVSLVVSTAGIIGFVGLIIPHIVRIVLGPDNYRPMKAYRIVP